MKEKKLENSSRWKHRTPRLKRQGGRAAEGNCRASCCQKRFSGLWWWLWWRSAAAAPRWPNRKESGGINTTMPPSSVSSHLLVSTIDQLPAETGEQGIPVVESTVVSNAELKRKWRRATNGFGEAKGEWPAHSSSSPPRCHGSKSIFRLHSMVRTNFEE